MGTTLQRLREEHADMVRLLGAFEHQLAVFEEAGTPDYDIIDGVVEYCLTYLDLHIHPKEELILSALLVRDPRWAAEVDDLREQHRELAALVRRLAAAVRYVHLDAELPRERFSALARGLLRLYRRHMEAEEHLLFTDAVRTLTPEDWAAIDWQTSREPAFLANAEIGRLELLRSCILAWDAGP
jgi:hemerythrin-like domain-containing protein